MRMAPGGIYQLELDLAAPDALHPAWLAGAVGVTYPGAEVASVTPRGPDAATVTVRARRSAEVRPGDSVVPLSEGLQLIPGASIPSATVTGVRALGVPVATRALTTAPASEIWKLVAAFAMMGAAAWAAYRVKEKRRA